MQKRELFLVAVACLLFLSTELRAQVKSETDMWREDLATMRREMETTHANLFHAVSRQELDAAVEALRDRIPQLARHQIIVEMMRIAAMIGDGHTNVYPTRDPKIGFHSLPIKLYLFSDGMFIRSATKERSALVGAKVIKIGGASIDDAVARVRPLIGRENEMPVRFFGPYLLAIPEVLNAVGLSNSPDSADLTLETGGKQFTVRLKQSGPVQMAPADTDTSWAPSEGWVDMRDISMSPLWLRDPKDLFWVDYQPDTKVLYVQFNQVGDKKDETLANFAARLTADIDAKPVEKLVLDLRLNRGGNGTLLKPLEIALIKSRLDRRGKLFILIGRSTFSAAQFFVDWMQKYSNAIFVGEPSASRGNHYGDSRRITLPNSGITVRASVYYWQDWDPGDTRQWIAPDLTSELSSADYRSNRDPVLATALSYIEQPTLLQLLEAASEKGGVALAVRTFDQFKADPLHKYAYTEDALLSAGEHFLDQKKFADAVELFKIAQRENPNSFRPYFAAGVALLAAGDKVQATSNLKRALQIQPKNYDVAAYLRSIK